MIRLSRLLTVTAFSLLTLQLLAGCNFYYEKEAAVDAESRIFFRSEELTWANLNEKIFHPRCLECHQEYGTYSGVKADLEGIRETAVVLKSMPRSRPKLSLDESSLLNRWIVQGAPEFPVTGSSPAPFPSATPGPEVSPEPSPTPTFEPSPVPSLIPSPTPIPSPTLPPALLPTYNSIREQILAPRCIRCHSTGGRAEKIPLVTLSDLLNSPSDLVVPGSPEESSLVISITRTDRKRMPPPSSGTALPPEQIQAVETWIKNGAKD